MRTIGFDLGVIVGVCLSAAFYESGYQPFFKIALPWWVYLILALIFIVLWVFFNIKNES